MEKFSLDPYIQHFSHPHRLELTNPQTLNITPCSACKLEAIEEMYTCRPCNFTLHNSCTKLPESLNHPSHPAHPLSLLPTTINPTALFRCDGCGRHGHGFVYNCSTCNFDLHVLCAVKPLLLTLQSHACPLMLIFDPPNQAKGFPCSICHKFGFKYWLYRCNKCNFNAHLDCAESIISTSRISVMQTQTVSTFDNSHPQANYLKQDGNQPGGSKQNSQATRPSGTGSRVAKVGARLLAVGADSMIGLPVFSTILGVGTIINNKINGGSEDEDACTDGDIDIASSTLDAI